MGLSLLDQKLIERQLPQRYYSVFNRRRETRTPGHQLPKDTRLELTLPNGRSHPAKLADLSATGMSVLAHSTFDDEANGTQYFPATLALMPGVEPISCPASNRLVWRPESCAENAQDALCATVSC